MGRTWAAAIADQEVQLGRDTVMRMAKIFVADSRNQLSSIGASLSRNEFATARIAAHDLAAGANALRFRTLEDAVHELEGACLARNHARASARHKDLFALVDICIVQLRDRYQLP